MYVSVIFLKIKEIIRNPLSILMFFFVPIGLTFVAGHFFEKGQKQIEIPIAIVDNDQTEFSAAILERMQGQAKIHLYRATASAAERMLERNEVDSVFVIKKGFQRNLLKGQREDSIEVWTTPLSMADGVVREVMAGEVTRLTSSVKAADRVVKLFKVLKMDTKPSQTTWKAAFNYTDSQWEPEPLMGIHYEQKYAVETAGKPEGVSPYLRLWTFFTMLSVFLTSDWIVREKPVLFSRIRTTFTGLPSYVLQSTAAVYLFHILQTLMTFFIFGKIVPLEMDVLWQMMIFVLVNVAASVFLTSWTKKVGSYYVVGLLLVFIIGILGGSFFPVQEISPSLQEISIIFPQELLFNDLLMTLQTALFVCGSIVLWLLGIWRLQR